jgi:hypothetical protein
MLPKTVSNIRELSDLIEKVGFIPLFKSPVEGFSVEELTRHMDWWGEDREKDPWEWRKVIASEGAAYGKVFNKKAGFISRSWFPVFASFRRGGMDFEERYDNGLCSQAEKSIMELLSDGSVIPSFELKKAAGFFKGGEKNFEGIITSLQMQTFILIRGFECKKNAFGHEYGWASSLYSTAEALFGEEHIGSRRDLAPVEAKALIAERIMEYFPNAAEKDIERLIK